MPHVALLTLIFSRQRRYCFFFATCYYADFHTPRLILAAALLLLSDEVFAMPLSYHIDVFFIFHVFAFFALMLSPPPRFAAFFTRHVFH